MYKIVLDGQEESFSSTSEDSVLRAGLRAGLGLPYECSTGSCGTCKFDLLDGETENLWPDAPGLSERDLRKDRRLACQNRPLSDCRIKVRIDPAATPKILPRRQQVRLVESRELTHDMVEFRFKAESKAEFLPGQYALFTLPGVTGLRAYSMANLSNDTGIWDFHIKNMPGGAGSHVLFDGVVEPGQMVEMDGPYGLAFLRESPRDLGAIAGGSGLSPMISIARGFAEDEYFSDRRLHFFFGGREPRDICGEKILRDLPAFADRMSYHAAISEPSVSAEVWSGPRGFVHELAAQSLEGELADYEFYFAGPPVMAEAVQRMLMREHKVPFAQLHFDRFF
ncbi:MAG: FAD-binding oxidoreductase [Proteobacteria bacterium]|nr:FAD-binding oxidoreductase [Pseudomonadota bacterium]